MGSRHALRTERRKLTGREATSDFKTRQSSIGPVQKLDLTGFTPQIRPQGIALQ